MVMVHALPSTLRRREPGPCPTPTCDYHGTLFHHTGQCWMCWSYYINTLKRPVQETPYELDAIRDALLLHEDQNLLFFVAPGVEFDDRWDGSWVDTLACRVPVDEPSRLLGSPWIYPFSEGGPLYAVIRWRYWRLESPAFLQVAWPLTLAGQPRVTSHDVYLASQDDRDALVRIENMIRNQGLSGRPPGSGQPVTARDVADKYWEWVDAHGKPPTQDDPNFSQKFHLQPRQLKNRLAQSGIVWPPPRPK